MPGFSHGVGLTPRRLTFSGQIDAVCGQPLNLVLRAIGLLAGGHRLERPGVLSMDFGKRRNLNRSTCQGSPR